MLLFSFFTERPARQNSRYLEANALQDAPSHFATALKCAASYKIWQLSAFGKVAITIATALLTVPPAAIKNFIDIIAQKLTIAIGPLSAVQPSDREGMWARFHQLTLDATISEQWNQLINATPCQRQPKAECLLLQKILKHWFGLIVKARNDHDFPPATHTAANPDDITESEQDIIHYVAGYIALKLKRFYRRYTNRASQQMLTIINGWRVPNGGNEQSFMGYSRSWLEKLNRGGLFRVNEQVFFFFRHMEQRCRPYLNKGYLAQNPRINIRDTLKVELLNSIPITKAWERLTPGSTQTLRLSLLRRVIDCYIPLRITAYLKALAYLNRTKMSKKGEKALRKDLVK